MCSSLGLGTRTITSQLYLVAYLSDVLSTSLCVLSIFLHEIEPEKKYWYFSGTVTICFKYVTTIHLARNRIIFAIISRKRTIFIIFHEPKYHPVQFLFISGRFITISLKKSITLFISRILQLNEKIMIPSTHILYGARVLNYVEKWNKFLRTYFTYVFNCFWSIAENSKSRKFIYCVWKD